MSGLLLLAQADRALAVCSPASPVNDAAVTCTDTTVDQNAPFGYGSLTDTGNIITVVSGASVTGTTNGIIFADGTVVNYGAVTGVGNVGIFAVTSSANVTNFGTITGGFAGIRATDTANVVNYGTIAGNNRGILANAINLTNSGTITAGFNAINSAIANVVNSGTISGGSLGISATTVTIINSGTITGGLRAINADSGNITNAGIIRGRVAIQFNASGADTLTLLPGSTIIGAINLGGGGDTVSFNGGNHNLTFDTLAGATVTGTGIFAVSGNQAAAVDPTQFAANGRVLGDFTRSVSQAVPDFGNRPAATGGAPTAFAASGPLPTFSPAFDAIPGLSSYAADQAVFKAPTVVRPDGTAIWARGFGGYRVQQADGVLLRTSSAFYGGAIGFEKQVRGDLRVGVFAGAGTTRSQVELNTSSTDSTHGFGGLYARYFVGASFLYAAVQGGGSHNDTTRNINNNLLAGGIETATASYSGWYVSPELKLGTSVALGRTMESQYSLTPSIGVRYLYGSFGGYTETGSTANLTVNSQTAQTVEERAELKLTRSTTFDARTALLLDITGGTLGIQRVGSNLVNAALLGQSIQFATPGKDDVWGGFGGLGMEWRTANVALFASGEYLWLSDSSTIVSGKGGVRIAF